MVVPPFADYSIYTQALTLDRSGRLFLSASCMAGTEGSIRKAAVERWKQSGKDGPQPPLYLRRMVLVSADGGRDRAARRYRRPDAGAVSAGCACARRRPAQLARRHPVRPGRPGRGAARCLRGRLAVAEPAAAGQLPRQPCR